MSQRKDKKEEERKKAEKQAYECYLARLSEPMYPRRITHEEALKILEENQ